MWFKSHLDTARVGDGNNDDIDDDGDDNDDDDESLMMMHLGGLTHKSHLFDTAREGHSQCRTPGQFLGLLC